MSQLKDMPVVTVEQIMRFRDEALKVEKHRDELLSALEEITADYKDMLDCDYGREYNHITEKCDKLIERVKECK